MLLSLHHLLFSSPCPARRYEGLSWLFFQMGGVGPMFGQFGHFYKYGRDKCDHPYPVERYSTEAKRLLGVLEGRLEGREFILDYGYSIVDMATFPWVVCLEVRVGCSATVALLPEQPAMSGGRERSLFLRVGKRAVQLLCEHVTATSHWSIMLPGCKWTVPFPCVCALHAGVLQCQGASGSGELPSSGSVEGSVPRTPENS